MFSTPTFDPYELFLLLITLNPKPSHSLSTPFLLFSSLYLLSIHHFTPPLILRVTLGYSGYSVYSVFTHLPTTWGPGVYHYLPYSSHLYPSSLPLLAGGWLHFSLLALLIILHLSFCLLCGSHYFPYSSSCISIYLIFILPQIYSLISFPLPTYLLYSTPPYIFHITYLLHFLNSPLYILPYSHFPYLSRPYPILHILSHITSLTCVPFIHFFITSKHYLPLYSQPN